MQHLVIFVFRCGCEARQTRCNGSLPVSVPQGYPKKRKLETGCCLIKGQIAERVREMGKYLQCGIYVPACSVLILERRQNEMKKQRACGSTTLLLRKERVSGSTRYHSQRETLLHLSASHLPRRGVIRGNIGQIRSQRPPSLLPSVEN